MSNLPPLHQINVNEGKLGENATLVQIYAPGHAPLLSELLMRAEDAPPFSSEWLLFSQQQVPLIGREREQAALADFLSAAGGFRWWGTHGPAGVGKSRLAFELFNRNKECWDGGFVSVHQQTVGAMSNWVPLRDTLWVMDYASTSERKLVDILSGMASRLCRCPHRVRVLLLDRTAGHDAAWWQNLFRQAGHNAPLLRGTLHGEPLRLPPVDALSHELLANFLSAAGWSEEKARAKADQIGAPDLLKLTDGGRPLLIAMVAAALWHDTSAIEAVRLMPNGLLDLWLERELRLMSEGGDEAWHAGLCRLLSVTTLSGGLPWSELPAQLPDGVDRAQAEETVNASNELVLEIVAKASDFPQVYKGLMRLERLGLSRANRWALQPDALGERLLHHMFAQPISTSAMGGALPAVTQPQMSLLLYKTRDLGLGHVGVLSRMEDRDVARALSLMARHHEAAMINVLRQMRFIARARQCALAPRYLDVLAAEIWGDRHDETVEKVAYLLMMLSRTTDGNDPALGSAIERLTAVSQTSVGTALLLWIIPFMTAIADLKGVALHAIVGWMAAWNGLESATTARSVILTLEVIDRVVEEIWPQLRDSDGLTDTAAFDNAKFSFSVSDTITEVYRRCFEVAVRLSRTLQAADVDEMAQRLASTAVNASYVLLAGNVAPEPARQSWLGCAATLARNGAHWARIAKRRKTLFTCWRNSLAAQGLLDINRHDCLQLRLKFAADCATNGEHANALNLLSDCMRTVAFHEDVGSMRTVIDAMIVHKDVFDADVDVLKQDNASYGVMLGKLLEAGRVDDATEAVRLYGYLTSVLPAEAEDGTLGMLAEQLAVHAFDRNCPDLLRDLVDILEGMLAAGGRGTFGGDNAVLGAIVLVHGVGLERAQEIPWRRLSAAPLAADDPRVEEAVLLTPVARFAQWISFTWENDLQRSWLAALRLQAG